MGKYGIFLSMGNAGFVSSTVGLRALPQHVRLRLRFESTIAARPRFCVWGS